MTLASIIDLYDKPGHYLLLEGKRNVAKNDQGKLIQIGELLASKTKHLQFRSGNAAGSDFYFSAGVASIDPKRLQVITPYSSHRSKQNLAGETISLESLSISSDSNLIRFAVTDKKTQKLTKLYLEGYKGRQAAAAAYLLRDTLKVVGTDNIPPVSLALFYDDLNSPKSGGTGHTMHVCEKADVPYVIQSEWMNWLSKR